MPCGNIGCRNSIRHKASEARGSQHNVDVVLYTVRSYKYSGSTSTCTVLCCVRHHVLKLATQTCTQTGSCSRLSKIVLETWLDTRQEEDFVLLADSLEDVKEAEEWHFPQRSSRQIAVLTLRLDFLRCCWVCRVTLIHTWNGGVSRDIWGGFLGL